MRYIYSEDQWKDKRLYQINQNKFLFKLRVCTKRIFYSTLTHYFFYKDFFTNIIKQIGGYSSFDQVRRKNYLTQME